MSKNCIVCKEIDQLLNDIDSEDLKNCESIVVKSKETGIEVEGVLCETKEGLKFLPKPIKIKDKDK